MVPEPIVRANRDARESQHRVAELITFLTTLLLLVTVIMALAVGILMGYGSIAGILWLFQHNRSAQSGSPALAHSTTTGD